jgi:hypothetical protein
VDIELRWRVPAAISNQSVQPATQPGNWRNTMEVFMRFAITVYLAVMTLAVSGCYKEASPVPTRVLNQGAVTANPAAQREFSKSDAKTLAGYGGQQGGQQQQGQERGQRRDVSLTATSSAQAFDRKIIRNAELEIELDSPEGAQRQLTAIAETQGGFVVTSESKINDARTAAAPGRFVTIVMRVPSAQFNTAIEKIRAVGGRILQEKHSGQDVTEEYIDLEARIRTQKALETQMIEILKRAGKISDALEVQNQIATVRTEIERLEGRRRFLENQSALSTINVTLHTPAPVVIATTAHGFWHEIKQAFGNGIDLASNITLGVIQFVIMLIPILLLIVLPLWLIWRLLRAHLNWPKKADVAAGNADSSLNV